MVNGLCGKGSFYRVEGFLCPNFMVFPSVSATIRHFKVYMTQKNIFCSFERPFKIQKNGVLLFEISFFILKILKFFYYAN